MLEWLVIGALPLVIWIIAFVLILTITSIDSPYSVVIPGAFITGHLTFTSSFIVIIIVFKIPIIAIFLVISAVPFVPVLSTLSFIVLLLALLLTIIAYGFFTRAFWALMSSKMSLISIIIARFSLATFFMFLWVAMPITMSIFIIRVSFLSLFTRTHFIMIYWLFLMLSISIMGILVVFMLFVWLWSHWLGLFGTNRTLNIVSLDLHLTCLCYLFEVIRVR